MSTTSDTPFSGQVVLVTGASSGIGKATALLFARQGARVIVSDLHQEPGEAVVEQVQREGGEAAFVATDVSHPEACQELVRRTVERFGRLDVAFNNAGISGEMKPLDELSLDGWNQVIAVNLSGVFYCLKYQLQQLLRQGGSGAIVNNSSILGQVGLANAAAYTAAKHGVVGLTQAAALEYSARGIRINAIGPAFIRTPMLTQAGFDEQALQQVVGLHPIGRLGQPEEVAELVVWLSSAKASFITGTYYPIDGGYLAR